LYIAFLKNIKWGKFGVAVCIAYKNILTGSTYDRGSLPWVQDGPIILLVHAKRIHEYIHTISNLALKKTYVFVDFMSWVILFIY
jgi:hypothetical protein